MLYFAFPNKTYINNSTAPTDTGMLWLTTTPDYTYHPKGEFILESDISVEDFPIEISGPEIHTIYGFNSIPTVKVYDADSEEWVDISANIQNISLLTRDGKVLTDADGKPLVTYS